jgi:hypothetical protein
MGVSVVVVVGMGAGIIFIAQLQPHPMLKQSSIDDEDYSTSHDIEMFFD